MSAPRRPRADPLLGADVDSSLLASCAKHNPQPTDTTHLLQGFTSIKHLKHIHARLLRSNLLHDCYLCNILLRSSFNFNKNTHYSLLLFSHIQQPSEYVLNSLIRGLVSHDQFHQSVNRFHSMRQLGFLPNHFTFPFVLKACTRVLELKLDVELHSIMVKVGYDLDVFVKTGLVCLYPKCGRLDDACKVFDEMPEKNVASWTAVISGYIGSVKTSTISPRRKEVKMKSAVVQHV
ncbi:putative tetratricopeptide-like helical domain superfamily [Helianthus anomalus]